MKIVYISTTCYADCDFPLVREWQLLGHEVYFFIDLACYSLHSTIINIDKQIPKDGIFPASQYKELLFFKDYLSLKNVYVINRTKKQKIHPKNIVLSCKLMKMIEQIEPDIIITTLFPDILEGYIYKFKKRLVLIVHDPFPHSGENSVRQTTSRNLAFKLIPKFVLLNSTQSQQFIETYKIKPKQICLNRLGPYDCTKIFLGHHKKENKSNNILFYGRISPYKGIEYLCQAMEIVHESIPNATLTIAGGGKIYFDITPYKDLSYIRIENHYVSMKELADLLDECAVNVCPYTDATQSGVVLTTYAMEKPIIATNVGGMSEYIKDGVTGLLVPPRNVEQLAHAIIKILNNQRFKESLITNIQNNNKSNDAGWHGIAQKYIEFFKSI